MKKWLLGLAAAALLLAGAAFAASSYLPIPNNVVDAAGALIYSQDQQNLTGLPAVATGSVLTSGGVGAAPAWSAAPSIGTSIAVGGGTAITKIAVYSQTITPSSVATIVCASQTFTVTGLTTADKVLVNPAATGNATSMAQARVSAADTLALMFCNPTAGALTPGAGTYTIVAFRS